MVKRKAKTRKRHEKISKIFEEFESQTDFDKEENLIQFCLRYGNIQNEPDIAQDSDSESDQEEE